MYEPGAKKAVMTNLAHGPVVSGAGAGRAEQGAILDPGGASLPSILSPVTGSTHHLYPVDGLD